MSKLVDFFSGIQVLEEVDSKINGKLTVVRDLAWGTYIKAGGLTQSGGILKSIWEATLKKVKSQKSKVKSCLILGLGGGSVAVLVKRNWPNAKITGVDIDPIIVELGKKYLGLNSKEVKIIIQDAFDFATVSSSSVEQLNSFDLICVDLYVGDSFPQKFESELFLKLIHKLLSDRGIAIFNRLYCNDKRSGAIKFSRKLEKFFPKVEAIYPEANIMFFCSL